MQQTDFELIPASLRQFFTEHKKAALAFSGGTDSAYLLWAARECGCDMKPFFIKTAFQPEFPCESDHVPNLFPLFS